jgi:hypothetical protein
MTAVIYCSFVCSFSSISSIRMYRNKYMAPTKTICFLNFSFIPRITGLADFVHPAEF